MKRMLVLLVTILTGVGSADVFYLQSNMPPNSTPNDKTLWYDAPAGGQTQDALAAPATGNRFDVNGFELRAPGTSKSSIFNGTLVVGEAGAGICLLYAAEWNLVGGMDVNNELLMRLHLPAVKISVSRLMLGPSGKLIFRTLKDDKNQLDLSVADLTGDGTIQFGITSYANDVNGVWNLSLPMIAFDFSGRIELHRGRLTFNTSSSLNKATLMINPVENNHIELAQDMSFGEVLVGVRPLKAGVYTASELNKQFHEERFSGKGKITVVQ